MLFSLKCISIFFFFKTNIDSKLQLNFDIYKTLIIMIKWLFNLMMIFFHFENLNFISLMMMIVIFCLFSFIKKFLFDVICFIIFELIIQFFWTFFVFIETSMTFSDAIAIHVDSTFELLFCVMSAVFAAFPFADLLWSVLNCFLIHFLFSSMFNHWRHLFLRWFFLLQ